MYELSRIRLYSVGPAGARYEDVTVDLSRAGKPVERAQPSLLGDELLRPSPATLLFLENGGGKSVLIKLIFSVMLPGRRQIVGTSNTRVLEKFVDRGDVAHVALEWMHTETGRLLLTGKVTQWRPRRSGSGENLDDVWYSLRPGASVDITTLPFSEEGENLTLSAYKERLSELADGDPSLELFWADRHHKWEDRLESLGLDPELFEFQRRMNAGEGEAADTFTFATDEALVEFLLKAVLPEADATSLGDSLEEFAKSLDSRDALSVEHAFLEAVLAQLDPLAEHHKSLEAASQDLSERMAEQLNFATSVVSRLERERGIVAARLREVGELRATIGKAQADTNLARSLVAELARRVSGFLVTEAEAERKAANDALDDATTLVQAWAATAALADWTAKSAAASQLRHIVEEQQDVESEALRVRDASAGALVAALLAAATTAETDAAVLDARISDLAGEGTRTQQEIDDEQAAGAAAGARADHLDELTAQVATEVDLAVAAGLVPDANAAPAVAKALAEKATADAAAAAEHQARIAQLDSEVESLQVSLVDARSAEGTAAVEYKEAVAAVERAIGSRRALAEEERLAELSDSNNVILETDADALVGRLTEALTATDRARVELRVADAADDRARLALSSTGALYPPPPEVEALVDLLNAEGLRCYSGWDVLADIPDQGLRRELVARLPHLATGVLLNDPDNLARARQIVRTAGYEPTSLVVVASTQSFDVAADRAFDLLPTGDVGFAAPPHEALYDQDAALVEKSKIDQRHVDRQERVAALGQRHAADIALRTRLIQWRDEYPPGRFAELSGWQSDTHETLITARSAVAACQESAAETEKLREIVRAEFRELTDKARAAQRLADEAAKLADRLGQAKDWRREADGFRQTQREATARADTLRIRRNEINAEISSTSRSADMRRATAARLREEIGEAGGEDKAHYAGASTAQPVAVLRTLLKEADTAYVKAQVGSDLLAEADQADRLAASAKLALDEHSERARDHAMLLLRSPDAADSAARAAAAENARRQEAEARKRYDAAVSEVSARTALYDLLPPPNSKVELAEEPRDAEQARQFRDQAEEDLRLAEADILARQETLDTKTDQVERVSEVIRGFERVADALEAIDALAVVTQPDVTAPFEGDPTSALSRHRELRKSVSDATDRRRRAERKILGSVDNLRTTCSEDRFRSMTSAVRTQIMAASREDLAEHAAAWTTALRPRLRSLADDLAQSERHRAVIVDRLQGLVEGALRTLRQAQRLSRLPANLGDWSGEEFLRFNFKPAEGEALTQLLADVVDSAVREPVRRDGTAILMRGVRAAVPRGFTVTMLKPDAVLRAERVRVSEVRDVFSGGQHLTAAIMLYCTLAALRSNNLGHATQRHSGVLFLDNPIGRASAGYLLDLQRSVASALGVQLIYTTGLFDAEALGAFPLIVRLRNDADLRAGKKYLSVEQSVGLALNALPDPDGVARLAATRLLLKERPHDQG